jgi:hypothetical protein
VVDHHFPNEPINTLLVFSYQEIESQAFSGFFSEFFQNFPVFFLQGSIENLGLGGKSPSIGLKGN